MPVEKQIIQIYAGTQRDKEGKGWLAHIEVSDVQRYVKELLEFIDARYPDTVKLLKEKKDLSDDVRAGLDQALTEFRGTFQATK